MSKKSIKKRIKLKKRKSKKGGSKSKKICSTPLPSSVSPKFNNKCTTLFSNSFECPDGYFYDGIECINCQCAKMKGLI